MMKRYSYVGPPEIARQSAASPTRRQIQSASDIAAWTRATEQFLDASGEVSATFIIAMDNRLWIADRRSEHVACAQGLQVLAAGELTFRVVGERAEVVAASNQSTGFCPEPESWRAVASALEAAGLEHAGGWTSAFEFRRCESCGATNIVKDGWKWCEACDAALSEAWNYG